jgi:hypothetical protein
VEERFILAFLSEVSVCDHFGQVVAKNLVLEYPVRRPVHLIMDRRQKDRVRKRLGSHYLLQGCAPKDLNSFH